MYSTIRFLRTALSANPSYLFRIRPEPRHNALRLRRLGLTRRRTATGSRRKSSFQYFTRWIAFTYTSVFLSLTQPFTHPPPNVRIFYDGIAHNHVHIEDALVSDQQHNHSARDICCPDVGHMSHVSRLWNTLKSQSQIQKPIWDMHSRPRNTEYKL